MDAPPLENLNRPPPMTHCFTENEHGFAVYGLRNERIELRVVPELGARVISLRDLLTNREWMWHPPGELKLFRNAFGDPFIQSTLAGLDECLPSLAACEWKGRRIPDHGEIWALPWGVDGAAFAECRIATWVETPLSPFGFARVISLDGNTVTFSYHLTNTGNEPEEFVWTVHPLLTLEEGDRMELPGEVAEFRINGGSGAPELAFGAAWKYPGPFENFHIDRLQLGDNRNGCVKGFTHPLRTGRAAIANDRTGDRLEFQWNTADNNTLGIWLTRGGLNGWHHVALEPTNGAPDSLAQACGEWKRYGLLAAGASKQWSFRLNVGTP
jgi:galactose mutarotase-like enzyme